MQIRLRFILLLLGSALTLLSNFFYVPEGNQFKLLIIALIILGVPHGAMDLYIERKNIKQDESGYNWVLIKYVLNIIVYATAWYFFPLISLVFFILITAYHFGEIDWMGKTTLWKHRIAYFILGLSWILYFLSINIKSALKIFTYVGGSNIAESTWINISEVVSVSSLSILILLHIILFFAKNSFYNKASDYYFSLLQFGILLCICHFSALWIGFGFYFGCWHSILSFDKIRMHFEWKNDYENWSKLLKMAMPFSVMAWIGMLFVMFMFFKSTNQTSLITLLFITLSVLTLPHLQVFTKLKIGNSD